MGRVCMGRVCYWPSLSWAEFVMGRVCLGPRCPVTITTFNVNRSDISPISKPEEIYDDIKLLIENLKEAGVRWVFISEILPRADLKKMCSLWSYQVQIREGQEDNKTTSVRDVRNRCHKVQ